MQRRSDLESVVVRRIRLLASNVLRSALLAACRDEPCSKLCGAPARQVKRALRASGMTNNNNDTRLYGVAGAQFRDLFL
jgi:hypothetical protein